MSIPAVTQDWFAQNAPKGAPAGDWFEQNAPAPAKETEEPSFLQKMATQPSKYSPLNPLGALDRLGKGMAEGVEAVAHPIDTAKQIYKTATTPHPMDFSDASDAPLLDQLKDAAATLEEGWGQEATGAALEKGVKIGAPLVAKGAGAISDVAQAATDRAMNAARNVTPKQAAQVGGAGLGAIKSGPFGAYLGTKLGKVAELLLGKDRANSPIFKQNEDLSLDSITDALAETIAQDRQRFTENQAKPLGQLPPTGAKPAAQTGEALATTPRSVVIDPATGRPEFSDVLAARQAAKPAAGPRFTIEDRAAAKSLLEDALKQHSADVVDQAIPPSGKTQAANAQAHAQVDFYLKQGNVQGAEAALDKAAKQANPAWTPLDRQPVPSTNAIRDRINAEAKLPSPGSKEDQLDTHALQQEMNWNLERHGWSAESEARREFIARNSTGVTKGELTGQQPKPVKLTKTPGVASSGSARPAAGSSTAGDLTAEWQKALDDIRRRQQGK